MLIVLLKVAVLCVVMLSPLVLILSVAIQVKFEAMPAVNGMLTVPPLQMVAVAALVILGAGFTLTVTVCEVPKQLPPVEVGVTVYITFCVLVVVLVIMSPMLVVVCVIILSPVVLALLAAIQVYVAAMLLVKARPTALPLQMVAVLALVMVGVGLTVTLTVCEIPAQLPALDVGVTV